MNYVSRVVRIGRKRIFSKLVLWITIFFLAKTDKLNQWKISLRSELVRLLHEKIRFVEIHKNLETKYFLKWVRLFENVSTQFIRGRL